MSPVGRRLHFQKFGFGFLDETGTLGGARDPFFAVGLVRCAEPYALLRPIQRIRDRQHFYDEIKWNKVSAKKLPLLVDIVNVFLSSDASFSAFVADKGKHDMIGRFGGPFKAYEAMARQLVRGSVRPDERLWIIADEYSTPPGHTFEENVRDYVNRKLGRQAVAGVCRMRSTGADLLQLIDLLIGAVVYEYKADAGVAGSYGPKRELLEHLKRKTGVATFLGGYRDERFNVAPGVRLVRGRRPWTLRSTPAPAKDIGAEARYLGPRRKQAMDLPVDACSSAVWRTSGTVAIL